MPTCALRKPRRIGEAEKLRYWEDQIDTALRIETKLAERGLHVSAELFGTLLREREAFGFRAENARPRKALVTTDPNKLAEELRAPTGQLAAKRCPANRRVMLPT